MRWSYKQHYDTAVTDTMLDASNHCFLNCSEISVKFKYGYLGQDNRGLVSNLMH